MRKLFMYVGIFSAYATGSWAAQYQIQSNDTQVTQFVENTYYKLPQAIRTQLNPGDYPVSINFRQLDHHKSLPTPECPIVNDLEPANKLKAEYEKARKTAKSWQIRYDKAVHTKTLWNKKKRRFELTIHSGFLPIIKGERNEELNCGHKDLKQTAEAAIIHAFVRAYDLTRYRDAKEYSWIHDRGNCKKSIKTIRRMSTNEKMLLNDTTLECLDLQTSNTAVSERKRYRTLAGNWTGRKGKYRESNNAMWPRAVNPYAFALDVQTHFAFHMENFILDEEFACRLPVLHEYLSEVFEDPHNAVAKSICKVNTLMRVDSVLTNESGKKYVDIEYYDLDPNNVETIYYYRAGSGDTGISSAFGHSMYRVVSKEDGALQVGGCTDADKGFSCDLILNHRANPMELRLDQGMATFGGYPSQLLIKPVFEIQQEYGDSELRHIVNVPLGRTTSSGFQPMQESEKSRFLYASLEQYWSYLGNYKFITNNCSDEAMRLYTIGSDHKGVQYANILAPKDIETDIFLKLGLGDESAVEGLKERTFWSGVWGKVAFWEKWEWTGIYQRKYDKRRESIESNDWVDQSRRYNLYDAVAEIIRLENEAGLSSKERNAENVVIIEKELKRWVELATVSDSAKSVCKVNEAYATTDKKIQQVTKMINVFKDRYAKLMGHYENLYEQSGEQAYWDKMYDVNRTFYLALYYAETKRRKAIGELAVQLAYEIGFPKNGKSMQCKGELAWDVPEQKQLLIKEQIEQYAKWDRELQPYSRNSVAPGYGIPLEKEITAGHIYVTLANQQMRRLQGLIGALKGEIGMDYEMWAQTKTFRKDLCEERINKKLYKRSAPDCRKIFADVYALEASKQQSSN